MTALVLFLASSETIVVINPFHTHLRMFYRTLVLLMLLRRCVSVVVFERVVFDVNECVSLSFCHSCVL